MGRCRWLFLRSRDVDGLRTSMESERWARLLLSFDCKSMLGLLGKSGIR